MGIRGLTKYLYDAGSRGNPITFDEKLGEESRVVVDAWALVFYLYSRAGIDFVCGGDHREFASVLRAQCEAWRRCRMSITVVWDGTPL
jgi:hypothetical protein